MKIKIWQRKPSRLTLKSWAAMDDLHRSISEFAKLGKDWEIPDLVFQIIELVYGKVDKNKFWLNTIEEYNNALETNQPNKKFPILNSKEKAKKLPWEYPGRGWYFWLHLFASHYGWEESKVAILDINDAVALYQEILIKEQLDQEWDWGLSEIAYPYDKTTKKSKFQPLPRPDWMRGVVPGQKGVVVKTKMPKSMMPQGNVVILDEE